MIIKPVVSASSAAQCLVLSVFGTVILAAFGAFYARNAENLHAPVGTDTGHISKICYTAAFVYACFTVFCGLQLGVHQRYPRGVQL